MIETTARDIIKYYGRRIRTCYQIAGKYESEKNPGMAELFRLNAANYRRIIRDISTYVKNTEEV